MSADRKTSDGKLLVNDKCEILITWGPLIMCFKIFRMELRRFLLGKCRLLESPLEILLSVRKIPTFLELKIPSLSQEALQHSLAIIELENKNCWQYLNTRCFL